MPKSLYVGRLALETLSKRDAEVTATVSDQLSQHDRALLKRVFTDAAECSTREQEERVYALAERLGVPMEG